MTYIDGFVMAVPTANKAAFIEHANTIDPLFKEFGALRVVEAWGQDVPTGSQTDFPKAVQCKDDETVVFAWVHWPDKATRDKGVAAMMEDPRMTEGGSAMPFDGKRMIVGGFEVVVDL